jgi:beta-carotene/zeaxanthin 4-ketolase
MDAHPDTADPRRLQAAAGLALAAAIVASWLALHIYGAFFFDFEAQPLWLAAAIAAALCWLYVGLFIVAHDCMHGSLVPGRPRANWWIGQICVALYAGFSYGALHAKHMQHHRNSGTPDDPDFGHPQPAGFAAWYRQFMGEYTTVRQLAAMAAQSALYFLVLRADLLNAAVFWIGPAILSSVQLFTFGTYLPHRPDASGFADRHNARSNGYPVWLSLLTCFHFGYHHEHHLRPGEPWWRLPAVRRLMTRGPR